MNFAEALAGLTAYWHDPRLVAALLAAVPVGMFAGVVPGLGGKLAIVMAIPFLVGVDPVLGAVFLLAMHSVVHTGGPIPSILFGVPGSGPDAATVVDGHPMARDGRAGRALGAALAASCVGGVLGALCLALALPVVRPLVLAFGPPEIFLLALLGISFMASVSGGQLLRGLLVGCLGLMVAFVGMDPMGGVARFTFGQLFLWDGVDLITAVIGLFAVPEMLALMGRAGQAPARPGGGFEPGGVFTGMLDVWRHRYLTLRASLIGTLVGIVPGLGGDVASWVAYGHAAQGARRPEEFGQGRVEGVIAPEAANNSKEGGSLLPTLFFGIPGSSGMAVMLGAFVSLGISPGATMAEQGLPLVWTLIWALVLANVLSVMVFLLGANALARVSGVAGGTLFPFVLAFALVGAWLSAMHWQTLPLLFLFGALGVVLKRHGWPRGPFAIGLVLGVPAEVALHQSLTIWGPMFWLRPLSLGLIAVVLLSVVWNVRRAGASAPLRDTRLLAVFAAGFGAALVAASGYPSPSSILPAAIAGLGLAVSLIGLILVRSPAANADVDDAARPLRRALLWFAAFVGAAVVLGISPGLPLAVGLFERIERRAGTARAIGAALVLLAVLEGVFGRMLGIGLFRGVWME